MRKQNLILLLLVTALAFGACSKYTGTSTNLVGTWNISSMTERTYSGGTLQNDTTVYDLGTLTFNKAGDGLFSISSTSTGHASTGTFDWFEQNSKVFINPINLTDSIMSKNLAIGFEVITNTAKQQVWSSEFSYYTSTVNQAGNTVKTLSRYYSELELNKQ